MPEARRVVICALEPMGALDLFHAGAVAAALKRRRACRRDTVAALFAVEREPFTELARIFAAEGWSEWVRELADDPQAGSPESLCSGMFERTDRYVLTDAGTVFINFDNRPPSRDALITLRVGADDGDFEVVEVEAPEFCLAYYRNAKAFLLGESESIDVITQGAPELYRGINPAELAAPCIKLELGQKQRAVSWLTATYLHEV